MQSENKARGITPGVWLDLRGVKAAGEMNKQQFDDSLWALPDAQFSTPLIYF